MKVVFILSAGHSGSTLLDLLLDGHSAMTGVGEMAVARSDLTCTCGKKAAACPLWSAAFGAAPWSSQEIYRPKIATLLGRGPYRDVHTHEPIDEAAYRRAVTRAYATILAHTGERVIVDSSKSAERAELLAGSPEVEPVVIHLVRDGRAVTWSYMRKYKRLFPYVFFWIAANVKIALLRRRWKGQWIFVRHEELAEHPSRELTRVCEALGLSYEPGMLDFRAGERHQIEGNRMRFGAGTEIRRDEAWRRDMPLTARALFAVTCGWLNWLYKHSS